MPKQDSMIACNATAGALKVNIFRWQDLSLQVQGSVEPIGPTAGTLEIWELTSGRMIRQNFPDGLPNFHDAWREVARHLKHWHERVRAIVHRVPFGHPADRYPVVLRPETEERLRRLPPFLAAWNNDSLAVAAAARKVFPNLANIAVFDTAYYATLPPERVLYTLPYAAAEPAGLRRYGVRGIAHRYLAEAAAQKLNRPLSRLRLMTCLIDGDSSITATKFGEAFDTTGGCTPAGGLTGATSCGNVDATAVTSLQSATAQSGEETAATLLREAGILGLFGCSGNLLEVLAACGHPVPGQQTLPMYNAHERQRAKLTFAFVLHELTARISGMIAAMGGADAIVFSGRVAERSAVLRAAVKDRLKVFGPLKTLTLHADVEQALVRLARNLALRQRGDVGPVLAPPGAPADASAEQSEPKVG